MLRQQNKLELYCRVYITILLDITIKYFQEFGMYSMKIFTQNNPDLFRFYGDYINDLRKYLAP